MSTECLPTSSVAEIPPSIQFAAFISFLYICPIEKYPTVGVFHFCTHSSLIPSYLRSYSSSPTSHHAFAYLPSCLRLPPIMPSPTSHHAFAYLPSCLRLPPIMPSPTSHHAFEYIFDWAATSFHVFKLQFAFMDYIYYTLHNTPGSANIIQTFKMTTLDTLLLSYLCTNSTKEGTVSSSLALEPKVEIFSTSGHCFNAKPVMRRPPHIRFRRGFKIHAPTPTYKIPSGFQHSCTTVSLYVDLPL